MKAMKTKLAIIFILATSVESFAPKISKVGISTANSFTNSKLAAVSIGGGDSGSVVKFMKNGKNWVDRNVIQHNQMTPKVTKEIVFWRRLAMALSGGVIGVYFWF